MDSDLFMKKFDSGDLGDDDDFFEWYAAKRSLVYLERKAKNYLGNWDLNPTSTPKPISVSPPPLLSSQVLYIIALK
ncbi:hypothetical protein ACSAZL_05050 [Methanosarcina sp. T3]|uniref:hypothetical protein n=1 Tax=Methanosarcina sp. T3 TaxID=3439062 RepID=UPI003F87F5FA